MKNRIEIKPGLNVSIVQKEHQKTGKLTDGIVQEILTKSSFHPYGIKVQLTTGEIGRVKNINPKL
ncbi:MAG TPA: YwbE family protein [Ignavibacteria bacterium]